MRHSLRAAALLLAAAAPLPAQQVERVDYTRAERFLPWHAEPLVAGDDVDPRWMPDGNRFWYRTKLLQGAEFVMIDPVRNTRRLVFDNARLAAALSLAADTSYDPLKLPFRAFEFIDNERAIAFEANKKRVECVLATYACTVGDTLPDDEPYVVSPDSTWEAFVHEYDIWIRPHGEPGDSIQLTTDGEEDYYYGLGPRRPYQQLRQPREARRPNITWSPDARKLVTERRDVRGVEHMHYVSYTSQRPRHFSQPYALPGDSIVPLDDIVVITVPDGDLVTIELPVRNNGVRLGGTPRDSLWSEDSRYLHLTFQTRAAKHLFLVEADVTTGASRILAADSADTFVETHPRHPPSHYTTRDRQDVIWWSERDGWAHLYRFGFDGTLKNQVTSGAWAVGWVPHVDETERRVYFTGYGRGSDDLVYHQKLYRAGFDGAGLTLLTPEPGYHDVEFSPSGQFIVDTYSTIATPPVTVLRRASDGGVIRTLERADVSQLAELGWTPGEVFRVKARDGITDLWGVMYRPTDFDSTRTYPIIDHIYPGPQVGSVGRWSWSTGGEERALAELGFIVVEVDHLGTPFRSKAFHDTYHGNFIDNGIPDHIAAIRQLAARHPWIDVGRAGIYGHSGGGFASTDAILRFPEFYKVAVSGAGNHDNRSYNIYWAEKYQGLLERDTAKGEDNFAASANRTYADRLQGKLLLMHGDMDDNVHAAMTVQLVDALIKANRDFDLVWAPDRAHSLNEPYFIRRRWDYFVRHLAGREPPAQYKITRPEN